MKNQYIISEFLKERKKLLSYITEKDNFKKLYYDLNGFNLNGQRFDINYGRYGVYTIKSVNGKAELADTYDIWYSDYCIIFCESLEKIKTKLEN